MRCRCLLRREPIACSPSNLAMRTRTSGTTRSCTACCEQDPTVEIRDLLASRRHGVALRHRRQQAAPGAHARSSIGTSRTSCPTEHGTSSTRSRSRSCSAQTHPTPSHPPPTTGELADGSVRSRCAIAATERRQRSHHLEPARARGRSDRGHARRRHSARRHCRSLGRGSPNTRPSVRRPHRIEAGARDRDPVDGPALIAVGLEARRTRGVARRTVDRRVRFVALLGGSRSAVRLSPRRATHRRRTDCRDVC